MLSFRRIGSRLPAWLDHWTVAVVLTALLHTALALAVRPGHPDAPPAAFAFEVLRGPPGGGGPGGHGAGPGRGAPGDGGPPTDGAAIAMPTRGTSPPAIALDPARPPPTLPARQVLPGGTAGTVAVPVDRSGERRDVLSAIERQQQIREALATAGVASTGGGDGGSGAGGGGGGGGWGSGGDPLLWRWQREVEDLFLGSFHPIVPRVGGLPAGALYAVDFDPETGVVAAAAPLQGSGNAAYDAAVERAIRSVPVIPLPPPEYRDLVGTRLVVEFLPPGEVAPETGTD